MKTVEPRRTQKTRRFGNSFSQRSSASSAVKHVFGLLAFVLFLADATKAQENAAPQGQWIQLFNGKDLSGWTPKIKGYELGDNVGDTFRVEDGVIKVSYDQYNKFDRKFGHIFYRDKFSHYRLRIEYRFTGEQCPGGEGWATRNSGVMLHCQPPETMAKDQDFPVSIEVQFLGGLGKGPRTTGNLCTPGTHVVMNSELIKRHCTNSTSKTYDGDQWVTAEVEVRGDKTIKHFINGEEVLAYEQPQYDDSDATARPLIQGDNRLIREGFISLQSESHPIEFRKVELMRLAE
jgi:hypothetical protein